MKKFTKEFLKEVQKSVLGKDYTNSNAKRAEKKLGIPEELYLEISKEFPKSNLCQYLKNGNRETVFMAGFIAGFVEGNKKIK